MKRCILPAKVTRPVVSKAYIRKTLFRLLDEGIRHKAVWISGPPGSGKTTLVSSYIESRDLPSLWCQVDANDTNPATFFHYLSLAARNLAPKRRKPLPHFTPEYREGLTAFTRNFFHDLFRLAPNPSALVLDNFQEASANPEFLEIICKGMREVPEGCCLILISRNDLPPLFARSCANREMKRIGWDDLRLTDREVNGISKVLGYKVTGREMLAHIQDKVRGWMAGLILMLEQIKSGIPGKRGLRSQADETVFNYFMSEVFKKAGQEVQDFLMRTSFLPYMTIEMAGNLTGNRDSGRILERCYLEHFFVDKRRHPEAIYQYHPLFREFLLTHAKKTCNREELLQLQGGSAHILKANGQVEEAARLFIEGGEWEGLSELILQHAGDFLSQGRFRLPESWLAALPVEVMERSPWLYYYLGLCRLPVNPTAARKDLEVAYKMFKEENSLSPSQIPPPLTGGGKGEGDPAGLFLSWSAIVDTFLYEWKDFKPLDYWIEEFEWLQEQYKVFPSRDIEERVTSSLFSALMYRQPQNPAITYWEERAMGITESSKSDALRISTGHNLILYYLWTGNITKAGALLNTLASVRKGVKIYPLSNLMWLRSAALYNTYSASWRMVLELAGEGLRLSHETGIHLIDDLLLGQMIYGSIFSGDFETAQDCLDRLAAELNNTRCLGRIYYHHQASLIALYRGDLSDAVEHAKDCFKLTEETGASFIINIHHYFLANTLLEAGKFDSMTQRIANIRRTGEETKSFLAEYSCHLLEAVFAMKKGDEEGCLESFNNALALGKRYGINCIAVMRPATAGLLCAKALEEGIEVEYVRDLIRLNNLVHHYTPDPSVEAWPWPIKIYTLGRFGILKDDEPVEFSRKAQKRPLAILKILISCGDRDVPEEGIIDLLWPDLEGDMAYKAFATALYRLRKLIGNDKAVLYKEGQLTLANQICWIDVRGFDHLLTQSEEALRAKQVERAIQRIEKSVALYKGPFLAGDAKEPWALSQREHVRDRFITAISRLGLCLEDREDLDQAIACYKRGIEADELAEGLYQRLMLCYKYTGKRTEAIKTYRRLNILLAARLGIEPSPETEVIYKSILMA